MSDDRYAVHVILDGRVQGVGFRMFVERIAAQLALTGWVRNKYDGQVEVWAEGSQGNLHVLLDTLRKGPPGAVVLDFETHWETPRGEVTEFRILPTE